MTSTKSLHFLSITALIIASSCASNRPVVPAREVEPRLQSAWHELRAANARRNETSVWDHVELRVGQFSGDTFTNGGEGISLAGRLALDNPFSESARDDAFSAAEDAQRARFNAATLELEVTRCERSMDAHLAAAHSALAAEHLDTRRALLMWLETWLEASELDALEAARLRLEIQRSLTERPAPPSYDDERSDSYPLPELETIPSPLAMDVDTIGAQIEASHPAVREQDAMAREHEHLAESEEAQRYPWLDFLELAYDVGDGPEQIAGRVAIEIPFGFDEAADAERQRLLAESARHRRQDVRAGLAREAKSRLSTLEHLAAQAGAWRALSDAADEAESVALSWLEQRLGEPRDVARLFDEVYATREAMLEARHQAGRAACELLALTGVPLERWPRRP